MILKTSFAMALISCLFSCSLRINEPELERQQINVKVAGQDCLGDIGETISRYTEGQSSAAEIDGFFACIAKAMNAFMEKTTSADPSRYQPRELAGFLSKYFLSNRSVPDGLLSQLMGLKQGIFGGERHTISRDEIRRILDLFDSFARVAKSLHPYMPLTPERLLNDSTTEAELNRTMEAIEAASVELGRTLQGRLGHYPVTNFTALLSELKSFTKANGWGTGWIDSLERWPSHFPAIKSVFVSPPGNEIRQEDWPRLFYLVPRTYALFLRYQLHFKKPKSFLEGEGLVQMVKILDESMMLLESAVKPRARQRISGKEIEDLLTSMEKLELLPYPKAQIKTLLVLAVNKFIPDPAARGKLQFSLVNLKELRSLYSYFTDGLRAMEGAFRQEYGGNFSQILLSRWHTTQLVEKNPYRHTVFNNSSTKVALQDLHENINKVGISFDRETGIVGIPGDGGLLMSHFHLTRMHYLRTLNKVLLRAYGNQQAGTISEKQVLFMLSDLKPVCDLFDFDIESLRGAVKSRMFEASLFLPSSDGDLAVRMDEAMELEGVFLSVLQKGPQIHSDMGNLCESRKVRGEFVIEAACLQRTFAHNIRLTWSAVPALAHSMEQLPLEERAALLGKMDGFLRKGRVGTPFRGTDTNGLLLIGYYMELLFYRFDRNHDGVFDQDEARAAFPLFRGFIEKKANELGRRDPEEHYKIYTYILAKQKIPSSFWEKLDYLNWQAENPYTVGRIGVMNVLSTMLAH